jgi:hypothetical protein
MEVRARDKGERQRRETKARMNRVMNMQDKSSELR